MTELLWASGPLWQASLGWLGASLLAGCCLLFLYQHASPPYRRALRNARWLVIPYLGLLTGGISPRLMGLTGIHWFASFGFGLILIGGVLAVLLVVRSVTDFSFASFPATAHLPVANQNDTLSVHYATLPGALLEIGAEEFHWAFLRSALWETFLLVPFLATQASYWAAWLTILLALPETLRYHATFSQRLCKCALLVATTVLFLFTRNLWLIWLLHALGWMLLAPSAPGNQ